MMVLPADAEPIRLPSDRLDAVTQRFLQAIAEHIADPADAREIEDGSTGTFSLHDLAGIGIELDDLVRELRERGL